MFNNCMSSFHFKILFNNFDLNCFGNQFMWTVWKDLLHETVEFYNEFFIWTYPFEHNSWFNSWKCNQKEFFERKNGQVKNMNSKKVQIFFIYFAELTFRIYFAEGIHRNLAIRNLQVKNGSLVRTKLECIEILMFCSQISFFFTQKRFNIWNEPHERTSHSMVVFKKPSDQFWPWLSILEWCQWLE